MNADKTGERWTEQDMGFTTPCWLWQRYIHAEGYGMDWYQGRSMLAHRAAWTKANGPIPEGMFVLHHCDIKRCVNPDHLFLGTQADNMADKVAKGRQARGLRHGTYTKPESRVTGERNGFAKLTEAQAREIFLRISEGEAYTAIAKDYPTSRYTVGLMARGERWRHVRPSAAIMEDG